jgi:phosphohistidine phosphatase SixA
MASRVTFVGSWHGTASIGLAIICLLVSFQFLASVAASAQQSGTMPAQELVSELRKGGLILYVRHAATDHSQSDKDLSDLSKCELQRNLSEQGRRESEAMGAAIRSLGIRIGKVFTSPYCRCVDTAEIAFGRYEKLDSMRATFFTDEALTRELTSYLRAQLTTVPQPGTNTVLVGHTANLKEVTDVWPKPEGVAHVFRPDGQGGFSHLGRILPTDWPMLAVSR